MHTREQLRHPTKPNRRCGAAKERDPRIAALPQSQRLSLGEIGVVLSAWAAFFSSSSRFGSMESDLPSSTSLHIDDQEMLTSFLHSINVALFDSDTLLVNQRWSELGGRMGLQDVVSLLEQLKVRRAGVGRCSSPPAAPRDELLEAFNAVGGSYDATGFVDLALMRDAMQAYGLLVDVQAIATELDCDGNNKKSVSFDDFSKLLMQHPDNGSFRGAATPSPRTAASPSDTSLEPLKTTSSRLALLLQQLPRSGSYFGGGNPPPLSRQVQQPIMAGTKGAGLTARPVPMSDFFKKISYLVSRSPQLAPFRDRAAALIRSVDRRGEAQITTQQAQCRLAVRMRAQEEVAHRLHTAVPPHHVLNRGRGMLLRSESGVRGASASPRQSARVAAHKHRQENLAFAERWPHTSHSSGSHSTRFTSLFGSLSKSRQGSSATEAAAECHTEVKDSASTANQGEPALGTEVVLVPPDLITTPSMVDDGFAGRVVAAPGAFDAEAQGSANPDEPASRSTSTASSHNSDDPRRPSHVPLLVISEDNASTMQSKRKMRFNILESDAGELHLPQSPLDQRQRRYRQRLSSSDSPRAAQHSSPSAAKDLEVRRGRNVAMRCVPQMIIKDNQLHTPQVGNANFGTTPSQVPPSNTPSAHGGSPRRPRPPPLTVNSDAQDVAMVDDYGNTRHHADTRLFKFYFGLQQRRVRGGRAKDIGRIFHPEIGEASPDDCGRPPGVSWTSRNSQRHAGFR